MSRVRMVAGVVVAALVGTLSVTLAWGDDTPTAAPAVTLRATPDYLMKGATVVLSGRAKYSRPGSIVKLQRRADGVWVTVRQKRTADDRSFRFRRQPRVGSHRFRVVKPRQYAQVRAVSRTVTVLVVASAPSVTLEANQSELIAKETVVLSGRARNSWPRSIVKLQRRADGVWGTVRQKRTADDRSFQFRRQPRVGSHRFRVVMPRQLDQPRTVSDTVAVRVSWRPTISVSSTGALDPAGEVWITTVTGSAPELSGVVLTVQRYVDGVWSATGESVTVGSDGQFTHVIRGGAAGTRYRYMSPPSGLRLRAWSEPVILAAEAYTPTIDLTVQPEQQQVSESTYPVMYNQSQKVTGVTNAPDAAVSVEVYGYRTLDETWEWSRYWAATTAADGSFAATLPNLPEGTRVRAIIEPSADGLRKRGVSDEVATTLLPIEVSLDGPAVDIYDVTRDRGTLVRFEATAGDLVTFGFDQAYTPTGTGVSGRLYGPDGEGVPEQQYVRGVNDQDVSRYFRIASTGTHTLVLSSRSSAWPGGGETDVRVFASTPKVVPVALDQETRSISTRPRQVVDLEFTGTAGQGIGIWPADPWEWNCPTAQLYLGDQLVPRRFDSLEWDRPEMRSAWELPADGTYHMRMWPCNTTPIDDTVTIVSSEEVQLEFGVDTRIDQSRPGAYAIASFATTAGRHIQLERVNWYDDGSFAVVVAPDGSIINAYYPFVAPQTGTYRLWLSPGGSRSSFAVWRATESDS